MQLGTVVVARVQLPETYTVVQATPSELAEPWSAQKPAGELNVANESKKRWPWHDLVPPAKLIWPWYAGRLVLQPLAKLHDPADVWA